MTISIDVILGKCIVAIQRGEMTLAECLERYPQYNHELSALLQTWQELVASPTVAPSPAFQRVTKTRVQNRLAARQPVTFFGRLRHNWHMTTQSIKPRRTSIRLVTITTIALLLFVGSSAGVVFASEGALPGDPLYSAKTTIEGVRLVFSDSDGDVELYNEFANERVEEMGALVAAGRPDDLPAAAQGYENALNGMAQALAEVASDDAARAEALAGLLTAAHEKRTQVLTDLLSKVPEQGQVGIQRALEASGPPEGKGKPDDVGKPEDAGCPENAGGPPEGKGKPEDAGGPPEDAGGPPEDAGPPEDSNAPEDAGPPEDAGGPPDDAGGPPEDSGPPEDAGPPEGCASENRPAPEGGEGDEGETD